MSRLYAERQITLITESLYNLYSAWPVADKGSMIFICFPFFTCLTLVEGAIGQEYLLNICATLPDLKHLSLNRNNN